MPIEFSSRRRGPGRPSVKKTELLDLFRKQIVEGAYPPGARLPSRVDLMRTHKVSSITVQRTFDQLIADGFVETQGKAGTRVCAHPPHVNRYGLAFASKPGDTTHWRGLDRALAQAAAEIGRTSLCSFPQYFNTAAGSAGEEDIRRLLADALAFRLKGAILASGTSPLLEILRKHSPRTPVVTISANAESSIPTVHLDVRSFFSEALDYLREKNRRRIAILTGVRFPEHVLKPVIEQDVPEHGMTLRPYWVQQIAVTDPVAARGVMHLMMHSDQKERPDGLIVADDNLTEHALAGIGAAGASVPRDIDVVTDANFPSPVSAGLPIQRIGYSGLEILNACQALLNEQCAKGLKRTRKSLRILAMREDRFAVPAKKS